jgi:hypothetical protein
MRRLKKLRKIYRILFPQRITEQEFFENKLKLNPIITCFTKLGAKYTLKIDNTLNLVLRDQNFSDYEVFKQIFNHGEYNIVLNMINLNTNYKKEKIIIDAGANVGYTSIFLLKNLENSKIYSIEPSSTNFEILKENINLFNNSQDINF